MFGKWSLSSSSPSSSYFKTKIAFNLLKLKEKTGFVLLYYGPVALHGTENGLVTMEETVEPLPRRISGQNHIICCYKCFALWLCFSIHWNCIRDDCLRRGICRLLCSIKEPSIFLPMDWKWFKTCSHRNWKVNITLCIYY